jgi:predicted Zn-dependent peptidase
MKNLRENGISQSELNLAIKSLMSASVHAFESNARMAQIFLFFKKCGINLDLFDKRGSLLSILKVGVVNDIARRYCKENFLSTIRVGRSG